MTSSGQAIPTGSGQIRTYALSPSKRSSPSRTPAERHLHDATGDVQHPARPQPGRRPDRPRAAGSRRRRARPGRAGPAGGRPCPTPIGRRRPDGSRGRGDGRGGVSVPGRPARDARRAVGAGGHGRAGPGKLRHRTAVPLPGHPLGDHPAAMDRSRFSAAAARRRQGHHDQGGAAGGHRGPPGHADRAAGGGEHPPHVRARLGAPAAAEAAGRSGPRRRSARPDGRPEHVRLATQCDHRLPHPGRPSDFPGRSPRVQLDHILARGGGGTCSPAVRSGCRCRTILPSWSTWPMPLDPILGENDAHSWTPSAGIASNAASARARSPPSGSATTTISMCRWRSRCWPRTGRTMPTSAIASWVRRGSCDEFAIRGSSPCTTSVRLPTVGPTS